MNNPFQNRAQPLSGPSQDIHPVVPSDSTDLPRVAVALYVESGGAVTFVSAKGETRSVTVADFAILPVGVRRVMTTGTTASGIHAFLVA
tara:strand:+ start:6733 stop:6999 length:267 start_codon:yes stop_codon:yes gene_type:complete